MNTEKSNSVKFFDENWNPVDDPDKATYCRVWKDGQSQTIVREPSGPAQENAPEA